MENKDKDKHKEGETPKDDNELVRRIAEQKYEFGFTTDVPTEIIPVGLNEDVVRLISQKKGEPDWLLEFRLGAFRRWQQMTPPQWGHLKLPRIDFHRSSRSSAQAEVFVPIMTTLSIE